MRSGIKEEIKKFLQSAGVSGEIKLTVPPKADMGDLAFACFDLAKEWKMSPPEAAKKIKEKLSRRKVGIPPEAGEIIERVDALGPYVNFYLNAGEMAKMIISEIVNLGSQYGASPAGKGKTILLEYPSNNTHKELHVGHLRNICIGNVLAGIFTATGHKVVPVNYLNDFGVHVAKCLWWIIKKDNLKDAPKGKEQEWLGNMYAEASRFLKEHPESEPEIWEIQKKLEAKDKEIWKLFVKTREWSVKEFQKIFNELKVKHDHVFLESDIKVIGQKMVDELLEKNIATVGEGGAIIADLKEYGLDIALLRKSNGSGLYLTSDLGLAVEKNKRYKKVDESIHVTGSEQDFYFKQLFKILELAGYKFKMTHIGYGLVNLPSGKISSREGNVVLYEDLKNAVREAVLEKSPELAKKTGHLDKITFAAIKFGFLKHEAGKAMVFNEKEAVSFDGFAGPYILYVIARINSIFKKAGVKKPVLKNLELLTSAEEKRTALMLNQYGETLKEALSNYNPSAITRYCFDLAQLFNDFYSKRSVLNAESTELKTARLALSSAVAQVLKNALRMLSIDSVDYM